MHKYILLLLLVFMPFAAYSLPSVKGETDIGAKIQRSRPSEVLQIIYSEEQPTPYQKQQIDALVDGIAQKAALKKFTSYTDLLVFINSNFNSKQRNTFLLKEAFAEQPGQKAFGTLDCDSKSLLALAVIEKLNYPFGKIYMADQYSHAVLFYAGEYFDMTVNEVILPSKDDMLKTNVLNSSDKIRSFIMSNKASYDAYNAVNVILDKEDKEALLAAQNKMQRALELDGKNITALHNLSAMTKDVKYKAQVAGVMMANYYNLFSREPLQLGNMEVQVKHKQTNKAVEAIKNSEAIQYEVYDVMADAYYQDNYEIAFKTGEMLAKAGISMHGYVPGFQAKALIELGRYEEARKFIRKAEDIRYSRDFPKELRSDFDYVMANLNEELYVGDIMQGKITAANIREYASTSIIIEAVLSGGPVNSRYAPPLERLRKWKGCGAFIDSLGDMSKTKKAKFCHDAAVN